jgi:hypothetical protein
MPRINVNVHTITNHDQLIIPDHLDPGVSEASLPAPTAADLTDLKYAGWSHVGIVAALVDDRQRILMLQHRPSDKTPSGAWGPLAETTQLARTETGAQVERTIDTLARGLREEVSVADPSRLEVAARYVGSWVVNRWPVGGRHVGQFALALCPVVHVSRGVRQELENMYRPNNETSSMAFMDPEQIAALDHVRFGTHTWLRQVMGSGLVEAPTQERERILLPAGAPLPHAIDAQLGEINYL